MSRSWGQSILKTGDYWIQVNPCPQKFSPGGPWKCGGGFACWNTTVAPDLWFDGGYDPKVELAKGRNGFDLVLSDGSSCGSDGYSTRVRFICDKDVAHGKPEFVKSDKVCEMELEWSTIAACVDDASMSAGWVLVLVFVCVSIAYCGGGALVNRTCRASTATSTLPNASFWRELYALVLEGCFFVGDTLLSCGRVSKKLAYQKAPGAV